MRVLLRADASPTAGTGHVMRSLALADALADRGHIVSLASAELPGGVASHVAARGLDVIALDAELDAAELTRVASSGGFAWIVLDGYGFEAGYVGAARRVARTIVIDDHAALDRYDADIVLNQNAHASRAAYGTRSGDARLLIGPRFALLRREFAAYRDVEPAIRDDASHVLVTLGGADPARATERVVRALAGQPGDRTVTVVIGAGNVHGDAVAELASSAGFEVVRGSTDMPALMAAADLAIAAAGSTAWELAFMGLPSLVVVIAPNQVDVAASLQRLGCARSLGPMEAIDDERIGAEVSALAADAGARRRMAAIGRSLVDGRGAERVVRAMEAAGVVLRAATPADARRLFDWANDPATRAASFAPEPIPWETHRAWLARRLDDADTLLFVAHSDGVPVGQVRFDRASDDEAVVSVSIAPEARGRGLSPAVIDAGSREAFARWPVRRIRAEIRAANGASLAAFTDAGFGGSRPLAERTNAVAMWLDRPGDGGVEVAT